MLEIYTKLLPVFAWFLFGVMLSSLKLAGHRQGAFLLKVMLFFTLPILVLVKLSETPLSMDKAYLPLMQITLNMICMSIMLLLARKLTVERRVLGVMLVSTTAVNNFFLFPFILAVLGDAAFVDAMIFDIGNALTTMTVAYAMAFHYGPANLRPVNILLNVVRLPPLWALVIAVSINLNGIHLPGSVVVLAEPVGLLTMPLILVSLGIYFSPRISRLKLLLLTILVRMLLGLVLAVSFVLLFDLQGVTAAVVILCGSGPAGFNSLTFSSLAKLDMDFAASVVSLSIFISLFTIPALLYLLQAWLNIPAPIN